MNNWLGKTYANLRDWFFEEINGYNLLKAILVFLIVLFLWQTFDSRLIKWFDDRILPYLSNLEFDNNSTILFVCIMFFPLFAIIECIKNRYYLPYLSFALLSFSVYIYTEHRIFGKYISTPDVILNLGYTDIIIILLAIFLLSCLCQYFYSNKKANSNSIPIFLPDLPISDPDSDLLDYSGSAKQLANDLEITQVDYSYSIGLISPWGTGKSSYLNLLEFYLKECKKFIIIKFNPRHSRSSKNIQEDFFDELFSVLNKYDSRFSSSFKRYLKAIDVVSDNKILSFLFDAQKIWDKESEKDKINNAIRRINKKIIIFIEDFDRLLSDEIIEVFKLIDGNASFTNLIFVTAYDKMHINGIIDKAYSNEYTFFSDKFFTIEIQIPLRPYDKIFEYFLDGLCCGLSIKKEEKENYKIILSTHIQFLEEYLTTLRDVKRFLNLFVRHFKQIQGEVDFESYLLLYLIKYKHLDEYLSLYRKNYIGINILESSYPTYYLNEHLKVKSIKILEILFSKTSKYSLRSINNVMAFDIYFHESVYGALTIKEMEEIFDTTFEKAKDLIDRFAFENKHKDLISFLESKNILVFDSKIKFERFIDILIYMNCKDYEVRLPYFIILKLLYRENIKQILEKYDYQNIDYNDLIKAKLEGCYPYYPNNITKGILIGIINKEFHEGIIFTKDEVLDISKRALTNLIAKDPSIKQIHINLLYSCISEINQVTRDVSLDKEMCLKIKELIKKYPKGYLENFVRLGMFSSNPNFNSIACEPFWEQIFGDASQFKTFLDEQNDSTVPQIKLLKNFWKLYENNDYKPIEFENQGDVQKKINNNLIEENKKLNELLDIERALDIIEKEIISPNSTRDNIKKYRDMISRIDKIGLYIKKASDIKGKIQAKITLLS